MADSKSTLAGTGMVAMLQFSPMLSKIIALGIAAVLSLLLLLAFNPSLLLLEERVGALGWTLNPDDSLEERITLVVIDEKSVAEIGPWPWERADIARLVTAIDQAGAQLQLHDITYAEPRIGDDVLLSAIENSESVIIAQTPVIDSQASTAAAGLMTHPINGVQCEAAGGASRFPVSAGAVAAAAGFATIPKGHNAVLLDRDGSVRNTPALVCHQGFVYPALSIAAFLQLGSSEQWAGQLTVDNSFFGPSATLNLEGYPGLNIPLENDGTMRVSFAKSPNSFRAVSATDVINGRIDSAMLDNAWALVGVTAFGSGDIVPTPFSGATFGVELHARLLASLLDVNVPYSPVGSNTILIVLGALFAAFLYALAEKGNRVAAYGLPLAAVMLPIIALSLHIFILGSSNIWLGWIAPALYGVIGSSSLLLLELARTRLERARVYGNLNSYLPADVAHEIAFSIPSSSINAQRRDVTLLNADLRNFSAFGEARPPEEIAAVLHYFFTRATEIIESQGGRVQEFKGDSLLAIWEGADRVSAAKALHSANAMQDALSDTLLPDQALAGLEPLALGIGIEQGPVLIGSIGPAHRRSHTLLGDTVSITLRIQEMTAELAQPILIGECAARQLNDEKLDSQGSYLLSGLRIPHTLFAPAIPAGVSTPASAQPNLTVVSGGKR